MISRAAIRAEAGRLRQIFENAGGIPVETAILQPADTLLDLYGEDIRARAYVTSDALRGEQMLRPDFTVPVVQMHMEYGAEPARYTYSGEVFRRQEDDAARANEYVQVGYEVFDRSNPAEADAEVFSTISKGLAGMNLRASTGDIGILRAAVDGLQTTEARKRALARHIWRPTRFRALLDRYSGRAEVPATRAALLAADDPWQDAGVMIGLRGRDEIDQRIAALREDAAAAPLSSAQVDLIDAILDVRAKTPDGLAALVEIAAEMPVILPAVERLKARVSALDKRGFNLDNLDFEAAYGRTHMEYYDGFVFGFYAEDRPDLPPVATGGRYDALTRVLGAGAEIPAVGGVIRPDLTLQLGARV